MTPMFASIAAAVTLGLVGVSMWLSRRGRDGSVAPGPDAYAKPEPAPWEREGGADLTSPIVVAPPTTPSVVEPPAGARFRWTPR